MTRRKMPPTGEATYRKVSWRIIPILLACYIFSYLDRVNVGFAKLTMMSDLGFSDAVYGLGAGIFFIGYFAFEIPSNVILHRVGAKRWIARIMLTWGLLSAGTAFVTTAAQFYTARLALGIAEAGFFPGVLLYLTYWYPSQRSSRAVALFMTAVPLTGVIGSPLSGWILRSTQGAYGLLGWQWLFVLEALPAVVGTVLVLRALPNGIRDADWLDADEKVSLEHAVTSEQHLKPAHAFTDAFHRLDTWLFAVIYFSLVVGLYGISFWLPTIIHATGVNDSLRIGLLTAIPYAVATLVMIPASLRSDRTGERRGHVAIPALLGAAGFALSLLSSQSTLWAVISMTIATSGVITALPVFWSLPTERLGGTAAAAGLALINSIGNLGGFVSPYLIGLLSAMTHNTRAGVVMMTCALVLAAFLIGCVPSLRRSSP
jgi:MFS family permease